jgi:serine/threonine-protein kinase
MEPLSGQDLHTALSDRGRLRAGKAVRTLVPIAHALREAHSMGIVHRDLKPENVFLQLTDDGTMQPKLVDFGVAKLDRTKGIRLTQTGALLGSPLYMSPEQARGDDVDHRADIWAFCVVLYEAITGRTPFEGKNYNAVMYAIVANAPPTSTSLGAGDEALWDVMRRGLEKDPDRRWQSMQDLGAALAQWLLAKGIGDDITGASIDSLWLHRSSTVDALASVMPPPDDGAEAGPPSDSLTATRIVQRRSPSRRAVWITAVAAVGVGTVLALVALGGGQGEPAASASKPKPAVVKAPPEPETIAPVEPPPAVEPVEPEPVLTAKDLPAAVDEAVAPKVARKAVAKPRPRLQPGPKVRKKAEVTSTPLKDPFR